MDSTPRPSPVSMNTTSSSSSRTHESSATGARSRATIHNADTVLRLSGGTMKGLQTWLRSFDDYDELVTAIRKEFKFMGPSGIYMWLYVVGEDIPDYHDVFGE